MKLFSSILLAVIIPISLVNSCFSQDITKVTKPREVTSELVGMSSIPKELEGLQWNRWTSKNFTVVALNDTQAQYLHKHLELVKGWCLARWGLYDVDYSSECKIIGVDNPALFKKLFNLDASRVEIRRDSNGKIKESVIFLLMNESPSKTVPIPLTEVCIAEFSQRYNTKMPIWTQAGMCQLNGTIEQIKERIIEVKPLLEKNDPMFFSKGLMEMDVESYRKLDANKQRLYDNCAMMFCLMIRKEFGQDVYLRTVKTASDGGNQEIALQKVLRFDNYAAFDKTFKRYMIDITREVSSGKTPNHYLQIREK